MSTVTPLFVACVLAIALPGGEATSVGGHSSEPQSRHLSSKLCRKYGICGGQGFGGHQGGYQGGYHGGYQGGNYQGGYPAINIGISQSQSSASAGGGGYGSGHFPNNYQFNGGYNGRPGGYHGGYNGYHGGYNGYHGGYNGYHGGYNGYHGGYNGYPGGFNRPGYFGNGFGSHNSQFNGNYYGGPQGGGYGFQGPFGNYYDEGNNDVKPVYEDQEDSRSAKTKN